jgi:hypothetical protein
VVEQQPHTESAACVPSTQRNLELPAAAGKSELPLSRFPLPGKPERGFPGGFPPNGWHAARQQKGLALERNRCGWR